MSSESDTSTLDAIHLQQQLDDKDQLIQALTVRLEDAAEQLDRIHRTGADRGGRIGGSESNSKQHQELIEQVKQSVELWEDVQPKDAFLRIEERLDDLREMLEGAVIEGQAGGSGDAASKQNALSGWEKMKAELMGNEAPATDDSGTPQPSESAASQKETDHAAPTSPESAGDQQEETRTSSIETGPSLGELELPAPIDFDSADRLRLEKGVEQRDEYICYLTRRLRSAESRTRQEIDWEQLNNAPGELRESLETLESELNDRLRIAEVDLSLERARLARVEARIRTMQQQIERKLRTAGHELPQQPAAPEPAEPAPGAKKESSSKSWFGSLGR